MYLEIDEGFLEHRKTMQLCASLGNPLAFGYLLHFWRWACHGCEDGNLTGLTPYTIEEAARYYQHDGKLYAAMVSTIGGKSGFIDVDANGNPVAIHNWAIRTGGSIQKMKEKAAENKKRRAEAKKQYDSKKCQNRTGIVPESYQYDGSTMPVEIPPRQDKASQDKARQDKSSEREEPPVSLSKRPSGFDLLTWFGIERASVFPNVLPWSTAMDKDGSADTFARLLPDDAIQDVNPSMRLALEHYRDGKAGWTDSRLKDPSFAFGAWKSQFTSLREELHGLSPKAAQPESPSGKPQATVRYPRLGQ